ncbi:membrane progestin receptor gamma isoform X3 [Alligator sinensis]|uniref:Membrane progestin receptor gamma isoform X3 n=1 Tax=Alligator sinensis TaxID=38654 RepID=A0A3Q0HE88_ALLSI|nr:membrane progestin receptor gamma isoform X3 [Alligator sinensis]
MRAARGCWNLPRLLWYQPRGQLHSPCPRVGGTVGYFLGKLLALLYALDLCNDVYAWPLLAYMSTCCIYPFMSSCAHTFSTMSTQARHICYFFDYGSLSIYSLGSAVAYSAYVFPEEWVDGTFHRCYVPTAVFNAVLSTGLSCYSRLGAPYHHYNSDILERFPELEQPRFSKVLRTLAFVYPYLFDSIPLFYRLYLCAEDSCAEGVIPIHIQHVVFAFLTCFIFTTHLPERLAPGHFDYIGHSHQVFHVCGIAGTYFQMEAIMMDMASRHERLRASFPLPTLSQTVGLIGVCLVINLIIIGAFSKALYSTPESSKREKTT